MTVQVMVVRTYNTNDPEMLQFSNVTISVFDDNEAEFVTLSSKFAPPFSTDWRDLITTAQSFSSDYQILADQALATEAVKLQMKACRKFYKGMRYYIEEAFSNPIMWIQFGYNKYSKVCYNADKLAQFMLDLFDTATTFSAELIAVEFPASKIADIKTLADSLQAKNTVQDKKMGMRRKETNERITLMNKVYAMTQQVCKAGKVIFAEDPAMYAFFVCPWNESPTVVNTYSGTIHAGEKKNVPLTDLHADTMVKIENTGPVPLRFCSSDTLEAPCEGGDIIANGTTQTRPLSSLGTGTDLKYLNVNHNVMGLGAPDGTFTVTKVE